MKIWRRSPMTGKMNSMDLNITEAQLEKFQSGSGYIQDIFPNLTPAEREFILTGATENDWDEMFPPKEKLAATEA